MTRPSVTPATDPSPTTACDQTSSPPSTAASTPASSPSPASTPTPPASPSWRLTVEAPDGRIWTSNDQRPHWSVTANRRRLWRRLGWGHALEARVPHLPAATIAFTCHMRNWSRVDDANLPGGPSIKGLLDGLVDARVIPDDREPYYTGHYRAAPLEGGRPRVEVEIFPKETP